MFVKTDAGMADAGFREHNDCAVRAYSLFKDVPYQTAHALFAKHGRQSRRGTRLMVIEKVMGKMATRVQGSMTLSQLRKAFPVGRVYAIKRGHAFTMIDGVLHDSWRVGEKSRIVMYWTDATSSQKQAKKPRVQSMDKKQQALVIYNRLNGTGISLYAIAKQIAVELDITVANANYYVTRVFNK